MVIVFLHLVIKLLLCLEISYLLIGNDILKMCADACKKMFAAFLVCFLVLCIKCMYIVGLIVSLGKTCVLFIPWYFW